MSYKLIIFDFDGTIAETLEEGRNIYNQFAKQYGYTRLTSENLEALRGKGARDVFRDLKIPFYKLPQLIAKVRKELGKKIPEMKAVAGLPEALRSLKDSGRRLGIASSNDRENISQFLKNNHLEVFDYVSAGSSLFGKSKKIREMAKAAKLSLSEILYVGDEVRDIEAARRAGVKIASVTWGANTKKVLQDSKPDYLFDHPQDLVKILHL